MQDWNRSIKFSRLWPPTSIEASLKLDAEFVKDAVARAKAIQEDAGSLRAPPHEVETPQESPVLPTSIFRDRPHYVRKIVDQINASYISACYDACAVLIRRLLETLIIEAFERYRISELIKDNGGNFLSLDKLIAEAVTCSEWNLGRSTKQALPRLKDVGNLSAHSRRFIAHRSDIDKMKSELRIVTQELALLSGPKLEATGTNNT